MSTRVRALLGAAALALAAGAAVFVLAPGSGEPGAGSAPTPAADRPSRTPASGGPISGAEFDRVRKATLDATGGGELTEIHRSDDPGEAYEVEVRRAGREIDFALDDELQRINDRGRPTDD